MLHRTKDKLPTEGNVHDRAEFPILGRKFGSVMHISFSRKFHFLSSAWLSLGEWCIVL